MSTEQRPAGFYWCRDGDKWEVAEWNGDSWFCTGIYDLFTDIVWDEIDPEPIIRKEG